MPFSQLQGVEWRVLSVEWGWPGRREPDDEHSPASQGRGDIASFKFIFRSYIGPPIYSSIFCL